MPRKERKVKMCIRDSNGIGYLDLVLPYGFTATLKANVNTRNSDYYKYENAVIGDARGTVSELSLIHIYPHGFTEFGCKSY